MRTELVFDGGRLHVLPLKETSTPLVGSPSVENGFELAGGITGGTVVVTSLENGNVDGGPLVVDPDGTSASIELVGVGPGRVLVSGKVSLSSTGTSEVFGGFTHWHQPVAAASADPAAGTCTPAITVAKKVFAPACVMLACLFAAVPATAGEATHSLTDGRPTVCQCGPECACGDDCRCTTVALAGEAEVAAVAESSGGNARRAALKMFLRRQATKAALRGDRAKARQLREALNDDDALDSIVDSIDADEKLSLPVSADGAIVDQIIKLLQWLIDNADAIIAIVMKIIPLFADPAQPAAALLDTPAGCSEWPLVLAC